jgi:hypothetical protein
MYKTKIMSAKLLAAGAKVRADLGPLAAAKPCMQKFLKHVEREIQEAQDKLKAAKSSSSSGSSGTPAGAAAASTPQPSTVTGGNFGTRFDVLRFLDDVDGVIADCDSAWDSEDDDYFISDDPPGDFSVDTPAPAVGYISAFAGKARALVGAVSRAASAFYTAAPKPAKYAVHPDTPVDRVYTKRDRKKISGKLKDQGKTAHEILHLLGTIQLLHFPACSPKHCSAPALTRSAARQLKLAPTEAADDEDADGESGESI